MRCPALGVDAAPAATPARGGARAALRALAAAWLPSGDPAIPEDPRGVVVFTGGNLGGAVVSLPLVEAVRRRFPRAHLAVVSNTAAGRELMELAGLGDSHHVVREGAARSPGGLRRYLRTLREIRACRPELMVANFDAQVDHLLIPLRIPVRVGHSGRRATGGDLLWQDRYLNAPVPLETGANWLESYRMLAARLGAPFPGYPRLGVPAGLRSWAAAELRERGAADGEALLAVQAGVWSHQPWKQWPPRLLAEACSRLWRTHGLRPVALGSDSGGAVMRELRAHAPEVPFLDLVGETSIPQAAALLAACDAGICNDSGLMHLSAAVGTPTAALYGMTDPEVTWCHGPEHRVVRRTDCRPCYSAAPEILAACGHKMCLTRLPVDQVVAAVSELLGARAERARGARPALHAASLHPDPA